MPNNWTHVILCNAQGMKGEVSEQYRQLMEYIGGNEEVADDELISSIDAEVLKLREDEEWMGQRMKYEADMMHAKYLGRQEGRAEGRVEGRAEGRAEVRAEDAKLAAALVEAGRLDELPTALADPELFDALLIEFDITDVAPRSTAES